MAVYCNYPVWVVLNYGDLSARRLLCASGIVPPETNRGQGSLKTNISCGEDIGRLRPLAHWKLVSLRGMEWYSTEVPTHIRSFCRQTVFKNFALSIAATTTVLSSLTGSLGIPTLFNSFKHRMA